MSGVTRAWFHCFSGIAGDMALGALLDAGADVDEVRSLCGRIPVSGWELGTEAVLRGGVAATRAIVRTAETSVVRTHAHIAALIEEARLPERVRARAQAAFQVMAEAEGRLHRRPTEQVHFHEVGALDAIVDIVGSASALEVLGVDEVHASPVANGSGMVHSAHGALPNPAPAVVELLRGAPTYGLDIPMELTTPTGAALLAAWAVGWGPIPPMTVASQGFGAGSRELDNRPNAVEVVIGVAAAAGTRSAPGQPVVQIELNVDDVTGEVLAHTLGAVLAAGAHDAWVTPILMKKGRPAYTVSALCDPALSSVVAGVLVDETGSLGVRVTELQRWPASRHSGEVEVGGYPVRVKLSPGRAKVEHDDAARVARLVGRPLREVLSLAEEASRRHGTDIGRRSADIGPAPSDLPPTPPDIGPAPPDIGPAPPPRGDPA
ncbi:MAG: nickel pincer cofactor biosynthesis protein LarC [Acidimicrobiia bacterium]